MTVLITHQACLEHAMTPGHPERPERLAAVLRHLRETGLVDDMTVGKRRRQPAPTCAASTAKPIWTIWRG